MKRLIVRLDYELLPIDIWNFLDTFDETDSETSVVAKSIRMNEDEINDISIETEQDGWVGLHTDWILGIEVGD